MKKLTVSLWLVLAAAGIIALEAMLTNHSTAMDVPFSNLSARLPPLNLFVCVGELCGLPYTSLIIRRGQAEV
jgi:hypothetical protein